MLTLLITAAIVAYLVFVVLRLGVHRRLPLIINRISLEQIPDRAARLHGDRPLFSSDQPIDWIVPALADRYPSRTQWSARRIQLTSGFLAATMVKLGVRSGDRVAICKRNHLDIHLLITGVTRMGAIACPMNGGFAGDKMRPYLENVGAQVLITDTVTLRRILGEGGSLGGVTQVILATNANLDDAGQQQLLQRLAQSHPSVGIVFLQDELASVTEGLGAVQRGGLDPIYLVHSSGTTGFPKAVILNNGAQSHAVRGWLAYVHLSPTRDRGLAAVPNNHQSVILTFNSSLLLGLPITWCGACTREDIDATWLAQELAAGAYTGFFAFPIVYTLLKEIDWTTFDITRMRFWASTADAAHAAIERVFLEQGSAFRSVGVPLRGSIYLDAQGSSEVGTPSVLRYLTAYTKKFDRRIGRPGSTPFGPDIRIAGPSGERVQRGAVGRLEVKGRTVFAGYWNNHALTCLAMRDGWFFTGDVAKQEVDGHIVQLDREVDVIHTAHGPVYSLPIEERLHTHPRVFDICVYGARQPDGTQAPAAAVALRSGTHMSAEALLQELNGMLQARDHLVHAEIMEWGVFPIGITGKTLKRVFRDRTEPLVPIEANTPVGYAMQSR